MRWNNELFALEFIEFYKIATQPFIDFLTAKLPGLISHRILCVASPKMPDSRSSNLY